MDHELEPNEARNDADLTREPAGNGRRDFLVKVGAGTALAWAAPVILSGPAQAAGTLPPAPLFMAVGGDGDGANLTTVDQGLTWTPGGAMIANGNAHAVGYSTLGNAWVAVGQDVGLGQSVIFRSTNDGTSWTTIDPGFTGRLTGVATDGAGNWVAVGQTITTFPGAPLMLRSSDNGLTWSAGDFVAPPSPTINQLHGIATNRTGLWVAVGQNNDGRGTLTTSTDNGLTWSAPLVLDNVTNGLIIGVATDGAGNWVIGGTSSAVANTAIMWFATGNNVTTTGNWTAITGIGSGFVYGIASDRATKFVAVGQRDDPAGGGFSYTLGGSLTPGVFPGATTYQLHEVATDQAGTWIAVGFDVGGGPMRTYTSHDNGLNWTDTATPASGALLGVAAKVVE